MTICRIGMHGDTPEATRVLCRLTRSLLTYHATEQHVHAALERRGYPPDDTLDRLCTLVPGSGTHGERIRVEVGWTRSECTTIASLLLVVCDHTTNESAKEQAYSARATWLRMVRDASDVHRVSRRADESWLRDRALASLRSESSARRCVGEDAQSWHRLDSVLDDVLRDLRDRCDGSQPALVEIDRWMGWLDRYVLPLVAVHAKAQSLAPLHPSTVALLDALRAAQSVASTSTTSDAVREWVRAGMPDTSALTE